MPMNNQYSNEDNQFQDVSRLLKELPQVKAPPDFELNLRRRINNLNYEAEAKLSKKPSLLKSLIPAAALTSCAIVVFIIFYGRQNPEVENPFMAAPELRAEINNTTPEVNNSRLLINPRNVTSNDVVIQNEAPSGSPENVQKQKGTVVDESVEVKRNRENIASNVESGERTRTRQYNFNGYENDVDKSLRARPEQYSSDAYYGRSHNVNFGGFNIIQGEERDIEELRARLDSIKKWMRENR